MKGNSTSIVGNVTRDPEIREFADGRMAVNFGICWNSRKKEGNEWKDIPNYFNCKMFCTSNQFQAFASNLSKGSKVAIVDGHLTYETWEKDGQKKSAVSIIVDDIANGFLMAINSNSASFEPMQQAPSTSMYDEDIPF